VCDYDSNRFTVVFRADDETGRALAAQKLGTVIHAQTGLGKGYNVHEIPDGAVLAAEDTGIPEMLGLARELLMHGKNCKLILGYSSRKDIFMLDSFRMLANEIEVLTLDGSNGREGSPADAVYNSEYVCASGSAAMLRTLAGRAAAGQFSVSVPILVGSDDYDDCYIMTADGSSNCCDDGPVYDKREIDWDELIKIAKI
jgi:dihydroorotate dehydrogenase electron transfer subunit